ncbi:tetratricopeptide repeat protein [Vibrio maritimus]|uniref:tetratricopeptide repeat protein n=1 Tax=Vibrio maritimus TaxID=990268 RepID=UPI00406961B6
MSKRLLALSALFLSVISGSAFANQELGMRTAAQVSKAYELEQEEKLGEAITLLEGLQPNASFDRAYVARMLGIYYWQAEQPDKAITQLQIAVDIKAFKDEQGWQTERMLAELMLSEDMPEKALVHFDNLTKTAENYEKLSKEQITGVWLNKARAHYLLQQWRTLLAAIKHYHQLDSTPKLQPLSLQLTAEMQLNHLKSAILTTQKLLALQPDNLMWWQQLSSLYMQTKQYKLALATLVSAERAGIEVPDNLQLSKAQLYSQQGIPEKAAQAYANLQIKETDIDTIIKQARHWQMAREWSSAQTAWLAAARLNAKYYEEVSRLELQQGDFKQALSSLAKVQGMPEQERLLLEARAYVGLKDYAKATKVAEQAHRVKPTTQSADWLQYLQQMSQAH